MKNAIYLDNAATTKLSASVKEYLISLLDLWGNPSSSHSIGKPVREMISTARNSVADFINANPEDIYFTPSGSASNTLSIRGYCLKNPCAAIYSPIAHKSILRCVKSLPHSHPLPVDSTGTICLHRAKQLFDSHNIRPFVIIDYANSEIGTIQNVKELIDLTHFYRGIVYLDCTGSISALPIDAQKMNVDILGFSGHKIGGLKGCGVLYKKAFIELEPLIYGTQEKGYVGGTENVLGIASLGKAAENYDYSSISSANRDYVYHYILREIPDCYLVGASIESGNRLPHNLYMCFQGLEGESLTMLLDVHGIQVSTGSACDSRNISASSTLSAIGMKPEDIHSCIRMTFSGHETKEELDYVCKTLKHLVATLRDSPLDAPDFR